MARFSSLSWFIEPCCLATPSTFWYPVFWCFSPWPSGLCRLATLGTLWYLVLWRFSHWPSELCRVAILGTLWYLVLWHFSPWPSGPCRLDIPSTFCVCLHLTPFGTFSSDVVHRGLYSCVLWLHLAPIFLKFGIDKSDESPRYQHVPTICFLFVCLFLARVIFDWLVLRKFVFVVYVFCFQSVLRLILWILKNLAVSLLLCWVIRKWIDVCFQPWYNPLWLTGLKAPAN